MLIPQRLQASHLRLVAAYPQQQGYPCRATTIITSLAKKYLLLNTSKTTVQF